MTPPADTRLDLPIDQRDAPVAEQGPGQIRPHRLGPLSQIPFGEGRAFDVDGQQIAVFRLRNGVVHAVSAVCPHRGGPIADGQVDGSIVVCPLHLNAFDLSSGASRSGQAPLSVWQVQIDGGEILLSPARTAVTDTAVTDTAVTDTAVTDTAVTDTAVTDTPLSEPEERS